MSPIRIVVPFGAGGATDLLARIVAEPMSVTLGQAVIVENRPGAGGSVGMAEVARAMDDHTLGLATVSTHGVNPAIYKRLPYDASTDFRALSALVTMPTVMAVHPSLPSGHEAFYRHAKANPGKVTFASPGVGSLGHMLGELYKRTTGAKLVHVPFAGTAQAKADVVAGRSHVIFDQLPSSADALAAGSLKAVAVSARERLPTMPDVPTFGELNLFISNDPSWFGLVAPARMPRAEALRIERAVMQTLQRPEVGALLRKQGMTPLADGAEDFSRLISKEISKMQRVAKFAGISMD